MNSLNVAVATGIFLYEATRQRGGAVTIQSEFNAKAQRRKDAQPKTTP